MLELVYESEIYYLTRDKREVKTTTDKIGKSETIISHTGSLLC